MHLRDTLEISHSAQPGPRSGVAEGIADIAITLALAAA
jgi:hypothetical protein